MPSRAEVARDAALAAADFERATAGGRKKLEEGIPVGPVSVVPGRARPRDPIFRLALQTLAHGFPQEYCPAVRLEWEIARRGYRRYAAYPAATVAGVFTNTVFGFMLAYILLALYRHRDEVGGYDATETVTYVWVAQAMITTVYIFGWTDLAERIRTGDITTDLTRPVHPLRAGLAFDLGRAVYHTLFRGVPPFLAALLVFDLTGPTSFLVWLAFFASVVLAVYVSFAFRFLYNLAAFWLLDFRGPMLLAVSTSLFFSGFIIPIAFFPEPLKVVAQATPFPAMLQRPVDIFIGNSTGLELAVSLGIQAAWAAALLAFAAAAFVAGTRKLVVQGG
jgi:ABC-2 type transport system permease protein